MAEFVKKEMPVARFEGRAFRFDEVEGRGYLIAQHNLLDKTVHISYVQVRYADRGQGIGKQLLAQMRQEAENVGAKSVTASIISRECLDAVTSVFGEEALVINVLGDYGREDTKAELNYQVPAREATDQAD